MHRFNVGFASTAVTLALACGDGNTEPPPDPPRPTTVTVAPSTATLTALEATVQFAAQVQDQYGATMSGVAVTWASSDAPTASVDAAGLVTGVANGTATITATAGSAAGSAEVTVDQVVAAISVSAPADSLVHGDTLRFAAEGTDANGHTVAGIEFLWASGDTLVVVVGTSGLATGMGPGNTEIIATSSEVTGKTDLRVVPRVPTTVAVTPDSVLLLALDATVRMFAEVRDQVGNVMSDAAIVWASDDPTVAAADSAGLVRAMANGTANITAQADTASGTARVTVDQVVTAISVSPPADSLLQGDTIRFTATGTDANGHAVPTAGFSWASSDPAVATVDTTGLATGVGTGRAEITATTSGVTGEAEVSVLARIPTTVSVTPDSVLLVALGATIRLAAEVRDQVGQVMSGASVDWTTSERWIAKVDTGGLVIALGNGTATITATAGTAAATAEIAVAQEVHSIRVWPAADTVFQLFELRMSAHPLDANGHFIHDIDFEWSSTDDAVAVVDDRGVFKGMVAGTVTIVAAANGVQGRAEITVVTHPDLSPLLDLYHALDGPNWSNADNWLSDAPIQYWFGVATDSVGRVIHLTLYQNELAGPIPPTLGKLSELTHAWLFGNNLTGPFPVEITNLPKLETLLLDHNSLTGPLPPELEELTSLKELSLANNNLSGAIPPELGNLPNLKKLHLWNNRLTGPIPGTLGHPPNLSGILLHDNRLTGPIPPELGTENLRTLWLNDNDLEGPVPEELGASRKLQELFLFNNSRLSGPLPGSFTSLNDLRYLLTSGTDLCAPADADFQGWLRGVRSHRIITCGGGGPPAYLMQAVQSREYPVPLVAGREALLRVFVTARKSTSESIPDVIATFYRNDRETYSVTIPGKSAVIPTGIDESSLLKSVNAVIPETIVQPDLEMVIEIDPDGTLDDSLGVPKRIPETGRLSVDVQAVPSFDLTIVPFLYDEDPDSSIIDLADDMAEDPQGHELLDFTRTLLPIGDLEVNAHAPVVTSTTNAFELLEETRLLYAMEDAEGYYMGTKAGEVTGGAAGVAHRGGRVSFSIPDGKVIAHEFGHNIGLLHAPCGNPGAVDAAFPQSDGSIGAWGYDGSDTLVSPETKDLMAYCYPVWVSEYNFTNMVRRRTVAASSRRNGTATSPRKSLLLWGGVDGDGVLFLEPAVVAEATPSVIGDDGDYQLTGSASNGDELFSFPLAMEEIADAEGGKLFTFAIPVEPEWADNLAMITLAGPEGLDALDGHGDGSVVIWRDPRTGQVRGILRDLSPEAVDQAQAALLAGDPGLEIFVSRGIPDAAAWSR